MVVEYVPATQILDRAPGGVARHPVQLTALLYLRDILRDQRFEEAPELLALAREFGAPEHDVEKVLRRYRDVRVEPQGIFI